MAKKLRSRLIRSPIPQGESATSAASPSSSSAITTTTIATTSSELARHSILQHSSSEDTHRQQERTLDEGHQTRRRRSQRLLANHSEQPLVATATASAEEQLFLGSTTITEPSGASCKRKPDNRGIIRRAKTAMFRIATSPMTSSSSMMPFYTSPPRHSLIQLTPNMNPRGETKVLHSRSQHSQRATNLLTMTPITKTAPKNVLEWMNDDAPSEIMLRILSFCGSRKLNALSRTSKLWNVVVKDESVWRVLSEDTHKWSDGDVVPNSWADYYKNNPCVPIDYDTVDAAFDSISSGPQCEVIENRVPQRFREQRKNSRILLHPGPYFIRTPLVVNAIGNVEVTIELVTGVKDPEHGIQWWKNYHMSSSLYSTDIMMVDKRGKEEPIVPQRRPYSPTLRELFGCGRPSLSAGELGEVSMSDQQSRVFHASQSEHRAAFYHSCFWGVRPMAILCLESTRENEPVIRIRQGTVNIRSLKFLHYCEGIDIWNGNAAIQVQRALGRNGRPLYSEPLSIVPTANLIDCDIMSLSGRGIVTIDGATSTIHNCNIHTCAATGVYVGGAGSASTLTQTDVIENGMGNQRSQFTDRRGVARGHSGVYVENGLAKIRDCNISCNTLTGISAVSTDEARLHIEYSDVRANRSDQMELPPMSSGRSINRNNTISSEGSGRPRSTHLKQSIVAKSPRCREEPSTPQSPLE